MFSIFYIAFTFCMPSQALSGELAAEPIYITDKEDPFWQRADERIVVQESEQALFRDSGDLLSLVSNTNVAGGTNRLRFFQIRGVGETSHYENTPNHSITSLVDGVDVTGVVAHWPLLDVDTLSVEKQPASVFFGGQAVGGLVTTALHRADRDCRARVSMDAKGGHAVDFSAPVYRHRLALHYNNDPGFVKNTYYGKPGDSRREGYASWVSDWLHTNQWNLRSSVLWANFNNRYDVWSFHNSRKTFSDHPGKDNLSLIGGAFTLERVMDHNIKISLWSSYTLSKWLYSYDSDWGNNAYWNTVPGWNTVYDYADEFLRHRRQSQQRLSVQAYGWTLGIHGQNVLEASDTNSFKNNIQRSNVVGSFRQDSTAAHLSYGQTLDPQWSWNSSVRYDHVRTRYRDHQTLSEHHDEAQMAAALEVKYAWTEKSETTASLRRGYKNPMINIDPDTPFVHRQVGSEGVVHMEFGHRSSGNTWRWQQSFFMRESTDQQVRVSRQMDPMDPSAYVYFYDNAAATRSWGYETSGEVFLPNHSRWKWSLGILEAKFRDYVFDGQTLTGRRVAYAPKTTWSLQWLQPLAQKWQILTQLEGRSSFYFSNNHGQKSTPYGLLHIAVQWGNGIHEWELGVRNVLDKDFATRAFYFANEPPDFPEKLYLQYGAPRTAYINYRARF